MDIAPLTLADLHELLPLHLDAFRGFMGVRLGRGYVFRMLRWFATDASAVGLVARVSDRVVGYVFGAPVGYTTRMNRALMPYAVFGVLTHPWILLEPNVRREGLRRLKAILALGSGISYKELPKPALSLVGIGVSENYRHQGIGKTLLDAYRQCAERYGFASLRLSVHKNNYPARRLDERAGWQPFEHSNDVLVCYGLVLEDRNGFDL